MTERTPAWTVNGHHWSGWPGAYCMKCFCEDPIENAFAAGDVFLDEEPSADHPNGKIAYKSPEIEELLYVASRCPVPGELVWNEHQHGWDLQQEDGSVTPYNRRPSNEEAK